MQGEKPIDVRLPMGSQPCLESPTFSFLPMRNVSSRGRRKHAFIDELYVNAKNYANKKQKKKKSTLTKTGWSSVGQKHSQRRQRSREGEKYTTKKRKRFASHIRIDFSCKEDSCVSSRYLRLCHHISFECWR